MANQNNKTSFSHADSNVTAEEDMLVKVSDDDTLAVPNQNNFAGTIITD